MRLHTLMLLSPAVLLFLLGLAWFQDGPHEPTPSVAATVTSEWTRPFGPVVPGDCPNLDCWEGTLHCPAETQHWAGGDFGNRDGESHNGTQCWEGSCVDMHPLCDVTFVRLEDVRKALLADDPVDLRASLDALGEAHFDLIPEREAVQVLDCEGHLLLHAPLPPATLAALMAVD